MSVELISKKIEASVLYSICESSNKCKNYLLSKIDSNMIAFPSLSKAYKRLVILTEKNGGKPPKWTSLCQDPIFDDTTKVVLEKLSPPLITTRSKADDAVSLLKEYRNRRTIFNMVDYIEEVLTDAPNNQLDSQEIAEHLIFKLEGIRSSSNTEFHNYKLSDGSSDLIIDSIINAVEPDLLLTGFDEFDKMTGGLPNGSLTLLAGTTGGGKSNLAMNMSLNFLRQKSVMYVPLEMTEKEMWARILSRETRITFDKINRAKLSDKEKSKVLEAYEKLQNFSKDKENEFILHCPDTDVSINEVLSQALVEDIDVVVIDYVSLLKGVDGDDAWQALSNVSRKAKLWAKIHNKRVILLAQLSDEGKVKYSKSMIEHANTCWIWSREADSEEDEIQIRQIKARGHSPAPFYLHFDLEYCYVGNKRGSSEIDDDYKPSYKKKDKKVVIEEDEVDSYLDDEDAYTPRRKNLGTKKKKVPVIEEEQEDDDEPVVKKTRKWH